MAKTKILVAEDEVIVGKDIQQRLDRLGYDVVGLATSAAAAVQQAEATRPDLVLMDIRLKGDVDGIEAAQAIRHQRDIPIVYLTAYGDDRTLERAKATEPSGYLLKPFDGKELGITIEIALQKHRSGLEFKEWVAATLRCIDNAVMAVDREGRVTSLNAVAEQLTGWSSADAVGQDVTVVFPIAGERAQHMDEHPVKRRLARGSTAGRATQAVLIPGSGAAQTRIEYSTVCIKNSQGTITGCAVVFRDIGERERTQEQLMEYRDRLKEFTYKRTVARAEVEQISSKERAQEGRAHAASQTQTAALKELLHEVALQRKVIGDQVVANLDTLVMPILERLKASSTVRERSYMELLERNLKELTAPFGTQISRKLFRLTPREIEICNMLKSGMTSKDMAQLLHIESSTVETHRNNIRRKLGLRRKRINTTSYLKSL